MTDEMVMSWEFQLMMIGVYLCSVMLLAHSALGFTRTLYVRNPYRIDGGGLPVPLFQGDYTIKLYSRDQRVRLGIKLLTLAAAGVLAVISIVYMTHVFTHVGYVWMIGNGSFPKTGVYALHVFAILCLTAAGIYRGKAGANRRPTSV